MMQNNSGNYICLPPLRSSFKVAVNGTIQILPCTNENIYIGFCVEGVEPITLYILAIIYVFPFFALASFKVAVNGTIQILPCTNENICIGFCVEEGGDRTYNL